MTPPAAAAQTLPWIRPRSGSRPASSSLELRRRLVQRLEESGLRERGRCLWIETGRAVRGERLVGRLAAWIGGDVEAATELPGVLLLLPGGRAGWIRAGRLRGSDATRGLAHRLDWLGVPTAAAHSVDDLEPLLVEWGVLLPGEGLGRD